jgi:ribosomal protein S18 acetylase RimI-like enzyme
MITPNRNDGKSHASRQATPTLRLLGPQDAGVFDRVADDVFDHPIRADAAREFLDDPRHHMAVALDGDVVVGMASAVHYVHPDKPAQLFINEVGVAPSHQRLGLASRLVALLLDRGRTLGCCEAWVATEVDNAPARALYTHLKGREDPVHAVVYTFALAGPAEPADGTRADPT